MTMNVSKTMKRIRDGWRDLTELRGGAREIGVELGSGRTEILNDLRRELIGVNFGESYANGYKTALYDVLSGLEAATVLSVNGMTSHETLEADVEAALGPAGDLDKIEFCINALYQKAISLRDAHMFEPKFSAQDLADLELLKKARVQAAFDATPKELGQAAVDAVKKERSQATMEEGADSVFEGK